VDFDLQRFYRINRRVLMWSLFFLLLYMLRGFFTLVFLTFILGFVGRQVATWVAHHTRLSYRLAVIVPYAIFVTLVVVFLSFALPRLFAEGRDFAQKRLPALQANVITEVAKIKAAYPFIDHMIEERIARLRLAKQPEAGAAAAPETQPATEADLEQKAILSFVEDYTGEPLPKVVFGFLGAIVTVTLQFLLAIFLSLLILLDYTRVREEVAQWRDSSVGAFFEETASSVVNFAAVVGRAFQCQFYVATLNAMLTLVGLAVLGIKPLILLTTIVFILGFIPVLGVFISSVPIILIALNIGGLPKGLSALSVIVVVHLMEAYVFNPRIYAARFHLNPVITLIILLIAHRLFGVWGMLLGIPVTHYALTVAMQIPRPNRLRGQMEPRRQPEKPTA
jgi:predicted PurR-regulated permease PerM